MRGRRRRNEGRRYRLGLRMHWNEVSCALAPGGVCVCATRAPINWVFRMMKLGKGVSWRPRNLCEMNSDANRGLSSAGRPRASSGTPRTKGGSAQCVFSEKQMSNSCGARLGFSIGTGLMRIQTAECCHPENDNDHKLSCTIRRAPR